MLVPGGSGWASREQARGAGHQGRNIRARPSGTYVIVPLHFVVAGAKEALSPFLSFRPTEPDLERLTKAVPTTRQGAVVTTPTAVAAATSGKALEGEAVMHETAMDTSSQAAGSGVRAIRNIGGGVTSEMPVKIPGAAGIRQSGRLFAWLLIYPFRTRCLRGYHTLSQ